LVVKIFLATAAQAADQVLGIQLSNGTRLIPRFTSLPITTVALGGG
jgi:hypothetical protein